MDTFFSQIQEQIRQAYSEGKTLAIRGGGTKGFWVSPKADAVLNLQGYAGILDYQPSELVVTVRAGTPLQQVESLLDSHQQMLAFEPPRFGFSATVGGTLACGLSGPRRANAGSARDHVLGVRILDGTGRDVKFGGQVIKNVAGFDVSRLMVGALGSLGVITEVSLRVVPKPPCEVTLEQAMSEVQAIETLNLWGGKPYPISASSYQSGRLRIRLSGSEMAVRSAQKVLGGEEISDGTLWWQSLREQTASCFELDKPLWRLSVASHAPPLKLSGQMLVEWNGALRWVATDHAPAQLQKAAKDAGGHATLFRGGKPEAPCLAPLEPALQTIHRNLKNLFDPKGVLNPSLPGNF
jgi:glycolate oxidase FAD binding subunit